MESRLFQALKAFKGAEGCEANLFEEFKKIAEAAFFSGYFLINGGRYRRMMRPRLLFELMRIGSLFINRRISTSKIVSILFRRLNRK